MKISINENIFDSVIDIMKMIFFLLCVIYYALKGPKTVSVIYIFTIPINDTK